MKLGEVEIGGTCSGNDCVADGADDAGCEADGDGCPGFVCSGNVCGK